MAVFFFCMKCHYRAILIGGAIFGLYDSLITNWLFAHFETTELNPVMCIFAGTPWPVVFKVGWPLLLLFLIEALTVKRRSIVQRRANP